MITDAKMPLEAMKKRVWSHRCGVCGGLLVVCWGGFYGYDGYILKCGQNSDHDTISDYKKPTKKEEESNKLFRRLQGVDTKALMKMDVPAMLARIEKALFPADLTPGDKKLMAEVSISYGLDPLMQELMIYQGHPYPTINARYRKAQESGKFDGINTRPATAEERTARHCEEFDILYCAEVWVKGSAHPFVGWGRVRKAERKGSEFLPIVKDPDRQAEKRAEAMGLRKAFSMPVPFQSWEEFEEQRAEEVIKVDKETGEIIDGEVTEVKDAPKEHWCQEHDCAFELKTSRFGPFYSHKLADGTYCNEKKKKGKVADVAGSTPQATLIPEDVVEPEQDKRGEFEKEGRSLYEEALHPSQPAPAEEAKSIAHVGWLEESLETLRAKNIAGWEESELLSYMKLTYKVEGETIVEAAAKLKEGQDAHFAKKIQDALAKAREPE